MNNERLVIWLDVDNTLLNNDQLKADLAHRLPEIIGKQHADRFWQIYEQVREEQGFVDYPLTAARLGREVGDTQLSARLMRYLNEVPFRNYLYPDVLETIAYLNTIGTPVIVSDGDQVYQRHKIRSSGLEEAVHGRVLITIHKEQELRAVFEQFPANHYVAVDDKASIISAYEQCCPALITTVLVMQGKYAHLAESGPKPDIVIQRIGDLRHISRERLLQGRQAGTR